MILPGIEPREPPWQASSLTNRPLQSAVLLGFTKYTMLRSVPTSSEFREAQLRQFTACTLRILCIQTPKLNHYPVG